MRVKTFSPAPGEIGSEIRWRHLLPGGRQTIRSGVIVGRAPALGAGHSREVWVVPDAPSPSDAYSGVVVAVVPQGGRGYTPSDAYAPVVGAGEAFSDGAASSPTGLLAVTNARLSRQQRAAA